MLWIVYQEKSAAIYAIEVISGKWRLPIMLELSVHESMWYNEFKHHLDGISNIMLTRALQDLETNGLIQRKELAQLPRHVEYSLTAGCQQLLGVLDMINEWEGFIIRLYHP
ncbi:transcriptional regulator, HxlR family [Anaerocolumna jejuensis DSM 15929]|uniref:Transcriptional regulator, HxlR family n=1 Tax=Anaerocolumna jejuensis DSM 15929 TaxID=1121322 RepID=A0A1M6M5Q5_9FIRM|nr:helix-turn-helix domain-containing protein [Anaerocolumna jejuensis]SHJ78769.1 transcriptional regulator, HxlR family [Anaerocolumna jejuensis DSM 15929]